LKFLYLEFFSKIIPRDIKKINFFNIDIEGSEIKVLKKINWKIFKPEIICSEIILKNFKDIYEDKVYQILKNNGYILYSKLVNSVIFVRNKK
jgi:hypothetical protein